MKKWEILKNIYVEKLVFWGKWFAKLQSENKDIDGKTIFITGWPIPHSRVDLRILKKRRDYIETQIVETIEKSPLEKQHPNNPYGMSGWWKWINIPYEEQLKIKETQVKEAFFHIQKLQKDIPFETITPSPIVDGYRNKVEFSFGKFISARYDREEHFNVWFHKQWEFSKIEDFNGCPLIDELQNEVYRDIKQFTKKSWLPAYDSMKQTWFFRHLIIRKTHFTKQMMLILWFNPLFPFSPKREGESGWGFDCEIQKIKDFFSSLATKHHEITSVYLSHNSNKADIAIWELEHIYGKEYITEELHGLQFHISPKSFFQTNSSWAEKLYSMVVDYTKKENLSEKTVLDLYWWTGTIWMIFAKSWAKKVYSVELVSSASQDGKKNAELNHLKNIDFVCAKVEDFLAQYTKDGKKADLLILDPPRAWMHPDAIPNILKFWVHQIIYVSCNPATLARDSDMILKNSDYEIEKIGSMDMFPHTSHIETIISFIKKEKW